MNPASYLFFAFRRPQGFPISIFFLLGLFLASLTSKDRRSRICDWTPSHLAGGSGFKEESEHIPSAVIDSRLGAQIKRVICRSSWLVLAFLLRSEVRNEIHSVKHLERSQLRRSVELVAVEVELEWNLEDC